MFDADTSVTAHRASDLGPLYFSAGHCLGTLVAYGNHIDSDLAKC